MEKKQSNRARVLDAAKACIARFGVDKTTMDDVAESAKLARMTVYRAFPNRNALLHAVAMQTLELFVNEMIQDFKPGATFEEDFIAVVLRSVELVRKDTLLLSIVLDTEGEGGLGFFAAEGSPIDDLLLKPWAPILELARTTQQLRPNIEDRMFLIWYRNIAYLMLRQSNLDRQEQERLLATFVMPSLLNTRCSVC